MGGVVHRHDRVLAGVAIALERLEVVVRGARVGVVPVEEVPVPGEGRLQPAPVATARNLQVERGHDVGVGVARRRIEGQGGAEHRWRR